MTAELLDTVVKLANAGSGGVSIFAILWTGWLLKSLGSKADENTHKTIRQLMVMCVAITIILFTSMITNTIYSANKIHTLSNKLETNQEKNEIQIKSLKIQNIKYKEKITATKKTIRALQKKLKKFLI